MNDCVDVLEFPRQGDLQSPQCELVNAVEAFEARRRLQVDVLQRRLNPERLKVGLVVLEHNDLLQRVGFVKRLPDFVPSGGERDEVGQRREVDLGAWSRLE